LNARAVNAEPLSVPSVSVPGAMPRSVAARSISAIASLARQRVSRCQATISRVQQTGRGHQVDPAVLGHPDGGDVEVPQLVGAFDAEEPRPAPTLQRAAALDQLALAHHPEHALSVHAPAESPAHPRGHHPVAVGRVGLGLRDDRRLDLAGRRACRCRRRPARLRDAVDRLAADLCHARHRRRAIALGDQLTRPGDAHPYSQSRKSFPAISSS
jgi:hypothetical protein